MNSLIWARDSALREPSVDAPHEEQTDGVTPALQFAHAILLEAETSPANEIPFLGPKNVRRRGLRDDGRLRLPILYLHFVPPSSHPRMPFCPL